mgnify:CR=1 FL=1
MKINKKAITTLKEVFKTLGPMFPGKVTEQYICCGKVNCRCQDKTQPIKHGPYHQLSWSINGKRSTLHVKPSELEMVVERIERYQNFKAIMDDFFQTEIEKLKQYKRQNG